MGARLVWLLAWAIVADIAIAETVAARLYANTEDGVVTRSGGGSVVVALAPDRPISGCVQAASVVHELVYAGQGLQNLRVWIGPVQTIPEACAGQRTLQGIIMDDGAGEACPSREGAVIALDGGLDALIGREAPDNLWLALGTYPGTTFPAYAAWKGYVNVIMGDCGQTPIPTLIFKDGLE